MTAHRVSRSILAARRPGDRTIVRLFVAVLACAAALSGPSFAQTADKAWRIGFLTFLSQLLLRADRVIE